MKFLFELTIKSRQCAPSIAIKIIYKIKNTKPVRINRSKKQDIKVIDALRLMLVVAVSSTELVDLIPSSHLGSILKPLFVQPLFHRIALLPFLAD